MFKHLQAFAHNVSCAPMLLPVISPLSPSRWTVTSLVQNCLTPPRNARTCKVRGPEFEFQQHPGLILWSWSPCFLELSLLASRVTTLNVEDLCYSLKALPFYNSPLKSWDYHTSYFSDITCLIPRQMKPTQELSTRHVSCEKRRQHRSRQFSLRDARKIFSPQISPARGYF